MEIAVDARKAFHAGIGTYIRELLPRVVSRMSDVSWQVLVARGEAARHKYLDGSGVRFVDMDAAPLSLAEQIELRRRVPADALFWATSLAHAVFTRRSLVATVHDVAQLALGSEDGIGALTRCASAVYLRSLATSASALMTNSAFTRDELQRHVPAARSRVVTVTTLGVDEAWFAAMPAQALPPAQPYFVCVGNVRPHKNLATLLRAFAQVQDRLPHELLIVGARDGFRTVDAQLDGPLRAVASRVRFTGFAADAQLRTLVAGADALVFPSLYEGFGLPALEAMATGCPVIVSRIGALLEVCGDAALSFDPHSSADLADRLIALHRMSTAQRAALGNRGRERARAFSWERTAELTVGVLRDAFERHSS